jgi:hypothetical protein
MSDDDEDDMVNGTSRMMRLVFFFLKHLKPSTHHVKQTRQTLNTSTHQHIDTSTHVVNLEISEDVAPAGFFLFAAGVNERCRQSLI